MSAPSDGPRRERALFAAALALVLGFRAVTPWGRSVEAVADDLLVLVGSWLLARTWFASPASAFFVSVAAAAADAPAVAPLPLAVWLLHRGLGAGSGLPLFFGVVLAGSRGPAGWVAALVLPAIAAAGAYPLGERLRAIPAHRLGLAIALGGGIAAILLEVQGPPRALAFGPPEGLLNVFLGLSANPRAPLFAGSFTAALSMAAVAGLGRRAVFSTFVAILLSLGILALAGAGPGPLRLLVVFLAGLGLDRLISGGEPRAARLAGVSTAAAAFLTGALSIAAETSLPATDPFLQACSGRDLPWTAEILAVTACWGAAAGGILLLRAGVPRAAPLALALLLVLHPLDVLGWKFRSSWLRRPPAEEARVP
jgi:hypothetical protein